MLVSMLMWVNFMFRFCSVFMVLVEKLYCGMVGWFFMNSMMWLVLRMDLMCECRVGLRDMGFGFGYVNFLFYVVW